MKNIKNFKIELNNPTNIKDLLQTIYKLADEQILQAQNEINKLSNATQLQNEAMDAKGKYAKAINDYLSIKDKAIAKKIDIAKILTEIYKHNGDVQGALQDGFDDKNSSFNFDEIRKIIDNSLDTKEQNKTIELNK